MSDFQSTRLTHGQVIAYRHQWFGVQYYAIITAVHSSDQTFNMSDVTLANVQHAVSLAHIKLLRGANRVRRQIASVQYLASTTQAQPRGRIISGVRLNLKRDTKGDETHKAVKQRQEKA